MIIQRDAMARDHGAGSRAKIVCMRLISFAISAMLISSSAAAQPGTPPADPLAAFGIKMLQPKTTAQVAEIRARIVEELARTGATTAFEDVTDASGGRVRHRASGLVCPLGAKGDSVQAPSADEAVCRSRDEGAAYEMRVARVRDGATLAFVYDAALTAARRETGFAPYRGISIEGRSKPGSGKPDHRTIRYFSRVDGRPQLTRLQVGLVDGWLLTDRKTGAPPRDTSTSDMSELLSEAMFGANMRRDPR